MDTEENVWLNSHNSSLQKMKTVIFEEVFSTSKSSDDWDHDPSVINVFMQKDFVAKRNLESSNIFMF